MINEEITSIRTKIFLHDTSPDVADKIRLFCEKDNLIRVKSVQIDVVDFLMNPSFNQCDLGAIFLSEQEDLCGISGFHIADKIHQNGSTIPIFMRLEGERRLADLSDEQKKLVTVVYSLDRLDELEKVIDRYLFSVHYPVSVVNKIQKACYDVLDGVFENIKVTKMPPCLIKDFIVADSFTSLIPLEMSCAKGYVMAQMQEADMVKLLTFTKQSDYSAREDFEHINEMASELVNLFWGRIRFRLHDETVDTNKVSRVQLPIIVNNKKNYISFGNSNPQLCFRYILCHANVISEPIVIHFKVIFNLYWDPSKQVGDDMIDRCVESGELELF